MTILFWVLVVAVLGAALWLLAGRAQKSMLQPGKIQAATCERDQRMTSRPLGPDVMPLLLTAACVGSLLGCAETLDASYETFAEAQRKGAVEAGWVPAWIPQESTGIREVHNIDTNRFMLSFAVRKGAPINLPASCVRIAPGAAKAAPFSRPWWPADVPANSSATHRHAFSACQGFYVAYSATSGEGYVWSST